MAIVPQYATATADGSGEATFIFPDVPQGEIWCGTTTIPEAPNTASALVHAGGQLVGSIVGPGSYGPWLCDYSRRLTISATGLAPGVQYQAVWHADDKGVEFSTYPAPITPTVTGTVTVPVPLEVSQGPSGTDPWEVNVENTVPVTLSGPVTVNQGTSPWVTSVSGTVAVTQSGTWTVGITTAAAATGGSVTMTGSAVALPSHAATRGVVLSAPKANTASITLNGGFVIDPGEMTPLLPVDNSNVFTATGTTSDVLSFLVT